MKRSTGTMNLDDLELELRKIPGVRSAGFTERDNVLLVQVQVTGEHVPTNLGLQATRIAFRHSDKPVTLEVVRWRAAEVAAPVLTDTATPAVPTIELPRPEADDDLRIRLLAVLTFPDTDELEVHLTFTGRRIIGRAAASKGVLGVVDATIDGLRAFTPALEFTAVWARELNENGDRETHIVACELMTGDGSRRLGIAVGASPIEAAARATLHALNRTLSPELTESASAT